MPAIGRLARATGIPWTGPLGAFGHHDAPNPWTGKFMYDWAFPGLSLDSAEVRAARGAVHFIQAVPYRLRNGETALEYRVVAPPSFMEPEKGAAGVPLAQDIGWTPRPWARTVWSSRQILSSGLRTAPPEAANPLTIKDGYLWYSEGAVAEEAAASDIAAARMGGRLGRLPMGKIGGTLLTTVPFMFKDVQRPIASGLGYTSSQYRQVLPASLYEADATLASYTRPLFHNCVMHTLVSPINFFENAAQFQLFDDNGSWSPGWMGRWSLGCPQCAGH
jgi:hypothetical protein